jgi:hypothetical protein
MERRRLRRPKAKLAAQIEAVRLWLSAPKAFGLSPKHRTSIQARLRRRKRSPPCFERRYSVKAKTPKTPSRKYGRTRSGPLYALEYLVSEEVRVLTDFTLLVTAEVRLKKIPDPFLKLNN